MDNLRLLKKYNVPVPRYTSYPTVPYWQNELDAESWEDNFKKQYRQSNSLSLYIHLPFCESLCTYCGCNKMITGNHSVEARYISAVLAEWALYTRQMDSKPVLKELHLGGGTPTFFSPKNLELLLQPILYQCIIAPGCELSFEGHPNNTTAEHLQTLFDLGFRRVSYGVQDNDPEVQRIINRIQPIENVRRAVDIARSIGYESVNFDLIYGLPLQTPEKMERTIAQSIALRPDRVAFYSYAHVPCTSRGQRLFDENDLPDAETKLALYGLGKKMFADAGYHDIGMDHFSLPGDTLYQAAASGRLYRNFMGYTTHAGNILLGLGVSAISDTGTAYAQNTKTMHDYYEAMHHGKPALAKGYFLTAEDTAFKKYILDIICNRRATFLPAHLAVLRQYAFPALQQLAADGLVQYSESQLTVTEKGSSFLRNICSAFDLYLHRSKLKTANTFSAAI